MVRTICPREEAKDVKELPARSLGGQQICLGLVQSTFRHRDQEGRLDQVTTPVPRLPIIG
jgi:hypothetical protein